jgi:hypothetical protein
LDDDQGFILGERRATQKCDRQPISSHSEGYEDLVTGWSNLPIK